MLKRVPIKEELVKLTGHFRKAVLLQQMVYWSEKVSDHDAFLDEEYRVGMNQDVQKRHGWIYKTAKQLVDETMMDFSERTIRADLAEMVEGGLLEERRNSKHRWDHTLQYRVNLAEIRRRLAAMGYTLEGYEIPCASTSAIIADRSEMAADRSEMAADRSEMAAEQYQRIPREIPTEKKASPSLVEQEGASSGGVATEGDVEEVFEYWRRLSGHSKARLTDSRKAKIKQRLRTFSVEELKRAADGAQANPFYTGKNDTGKEYNYPDTIYKNDDVVERHIEYLERGGARPKQMQGMARGIVTNRAEVEGRFL